VLEFLVEVHDLDARHLDAVLLEHPGLDRGVGDVLGLLGGGGLHLDHPPPVAFRKQDICVDAHSVSFESALEDRPLARGHQPLRDRDAIGRGLVEVDQHSASEFIPGEGADLCALVKSVLKDLVRLELDGAGLVGFPPEQLVALLAGGEEGFGEGRHQVQHTAFVEAAPAHRGEFRQRRSRDGCCGPARTLREANRGKALRASPRVGFDGVYPEERSDERAIAVHNTIRRSLPGIRRYARNRIRELLRQARIEMMTQFSTRVIPLLRLSPPCNL
jgi:hypothetical protein